MSQYRFLIYDGPLAADEYALELPDLPAARTTAVRLASELLRDASDAMWRGEDCKVQVSDEHDLTLFSIIFYAVNAPVLTKT